MPRRQASSKSLVLTIVGCTLSILAILSGVWIVNSTYSKGIFSKLSPHETRNFQKILSLMKEELQQGNYTFNHLENHQ